MSSITQFVPTRMVVGDIAEATLCGLHSQATLNSDLDLDLGSASCLLVF